MCSWCWGFKPALSTLLDRLPASIEIKRLLGGLAPDSDLPMPVEMQEMLQNTWRHIQNVIPGTHFNFQFWSENQPKRSTWPACRAVLAARLQDPALEVPMIDAIQHAYYVNALNPSNDDTLVALATRIGCDSSRFSNDLHSQLLRTQLAVEISKARDLGVRGFPSLVFLPGDGRQHSVTIDYNNPETMIDQIVQLNVA